jgi:hypothetical protein
MADWTPALLPNLQAWFDAQDSSTITLDGSSRVEAWVDKSANGISLGNSTAGERPNEGTINGFNAINFDASQWMEPDSYPISLNENRAITAYIVFEVDDDVGPHRLMSVPYSGRELFDYYNFSMSRNAGVLDVTWGSGSNTNGFNFNQFRTEGWNTTALTPYLYGVSITTAGAVARHDGASQSLTNRSSGTITVSNFLVSAPASPDVSIQLGCYNNAGAISQEMNGRIGEIIFCNDDESLFDKQRIEGYLAHKWGLEADLPSDHPFKAAPPEVPQDPYYDNVFLQLSFDGTDGDTDTVGNEIDPLAVTFAGTAQLDDAQKKFGDTSLLLDGNSDYITVASNTVWNFLHNNSEDYTIEFWFRVNASTGTTQIIYDTGLSTTHRGASVYIVDSSGTLTLSSIVARGTSGTYAAQINGATALSTGTWHHCAAVVSGTQLELFLDGSSEGTATISSPSVSNAQYALNLGRYQQGNSAWFNGHIDDFKVTKGVARYLGDFLVPDRSTTTIAVDSSYDDVTLLLPFDGTDGGTATSDQSGSSNTITFNGNAQLDDAQAKFGDTSLLLDGVSDYVSVGSGAAITGTGDFTIEMWYRPNADGTNQVLYDQRPASTQGVYPTIYRNTSNKLLFFTDSADRITGTTNIVAGSWYHVAVSRAAGTTRLFVNGVQEGSNYTDSNSYLNGASRPILGSSGVDTTTLEIDGWLDDVRVTDGFARYTAAFTSPESAFYFPPVTSQTISVVQAAEADTARTITFAVGSLQIAVGQATETDTAQSITINIPNTIAIGIATEIDSAGNITPLGFAQSAIQMPINYRLGAQPGEFWLEFGIDDGFNYMYSIDEDYNRVPLGQLYDASELPKSDPEVAGEFWNDDGILKVSNG